MSGKVYMIPCPISEDTQHEVIPPSVLQAISGLDYFLVENVRTARRFIASLKIFPSVEPLKFEVLDKDTSRQRVLELLDPVKKGSSVGILSEAGCPGVADPGALGAAVAHELGIEVIPLVGPSSILLGLMASGLNGQRFAFHGYLPIEPREFERSVKELERESRTKNQTQLFIETPYRNNKVAASLIKVLHPGTRLTVALDITGSLQNIKTMRVDEWRKNLPELPKAPAVFLILAGHV